MAKGVRSMVVALVTGVLVFVPQTAWAERQDQRLTTTRMVHPEDRAQAADQGLSAPGDAVLRGVTHEEYEQLSVNAQLDLKIANATTIDEIEDLSIREAIAATSTPFAEATNVVSQRLQPIFDEYGDVLARFEANEASDEFILSISDQADPARSATFIELVSGEIDPLGYIARFEKAKYTRDSLQRVIAEFHSEEVWVKRFGGGSFTSLPDVGGDGVVSVFTEREPDPMWTKFLHHGVTVVVHYEGEGVISLQSRVADLSPYYTGIRLTNSSNNALKCTSGFHWRRWDTQVVHPSTAEHCFRDLGITDWYNNYSLVGVTRAYYGDYADTQLLIPASGKSYKGGVYVGGPTGSAYMPLVSASTVPIGGVVAMHSGVSNPAATTVHVVGGKSTYKPKLYGADYTVGGISVTWAALGAHCNPGDSGGPWITSNSSNQAAAHGQHLGTIKMYGNEYCAFVDVNHISAVTQSSLVLW